MRGRRGLERRRKSKTYQRLFSAAVQVGLALRAPAGLKRWCLDGLWTTSQVPAFWALDLNVINAPSVSKWSVLVEGKDFL